MKTTKIFVIAAMLFSSSTAFAKTYVGVQAGAMSTNIRAEDTAQALANITGQTTTVTYTHGAFSGRAFVGQTVAKNVDLEAGFFATSNVWANYSSTSLKASESYRSIGLDLSTKVTVFNIASDPVYVRVGGHYSKLSYKGAVSVGSAAVSLTGSESGFGYLVGAGGTHKLTKNDSLNLDYIYMPGLGNAKDADGHMFLVGVTHSL